jgi:hypothetical protein
MRKPQMGVSAKPTLAVPTVMVWNRGMEHGHGTGVWNKVFRTAALTHGLLPSRCVRGRGGFWNTGMEQGYGKRVWDMGMEQGQGAMGTAACSIGGGSRMCPNRCRRGSSAKVAGWSHGGQVVYGKGASPTAPLALSPCRAALPGGHEPPPAGLRGPVVKQRPAEVQTGDQGCRPRPASQPWPGPPAAHDPSPRPSGSCHGPSSHRPPRTPVCPAPQASMRPAQG